MPVLWRLWDPSHRISFLAPSTQLVPCLYSFCLSGFPFLASPLLSSSAAKLHGDPLVLTAWVCINPAAFSYVISMLGLQPHILLCSCSSVQTPDLENTYLCLQVTMHTELPGSAHKLLLSLHANTGEANLPAESKTWHLCPRDS